MRLYSILLLLAFLMPERTWAELIYVSEQHSYAIKSLDEYEYTVELQGKNTGDNPVRVPVYLRESSKILLQNIEILKGDKWKKTEVPTIESTMDFSSFFSGSKMIYYEIPGHSDFRIHISLAEQHAVFVSRLDSKGLYEATQVSYALHVPEGLICTSNDGQKRTGTIALNGTELERDLFVLIHPVEQEPLTYFEAWFAARVNPLIEIEESLIPESLKEAGSTKSGEDLAREIFRFVQKKIRYVDIENGINAIIPRHCETVLKRGYGDCKDMATLLVALYRAFGFEAWPTISRTNTKDGTFDFPAISQANHMICTLKMDEEWIYLDATEIACIFGDPSMQILGTEALLIGNPQVDFVEVPSAVISESQARFSFNFDQSAKEVRTEIKASGKMSHLGSYLQMIELNPAKQYTDILQALTGMKWTCQEFLADEYHTDVHAAAPIGVSTVTKIGSRALYDVSFLPKMKVLCKLCFGRDYPTFEAPITVALQFEGKVDMEQFSSLEGPGMQFSAQGQELVITFQLPVFKTSEEFEAHEINAQWNKLRSKPITVYEN